MTAQIAIVLGIFVAAIVLFVLEAFSIDLVALLVLLALAIFKALTVQQAFDSFANSAVIMVALILVLTQGVTKTGITDRAGHLIYRLAGRGEKATLAVVLLLVMSVSAFINNTAATAMFIPAIMSLAKSTRRSASRWLIPLAYGSMLGGSCTLIGTSTNVAVSGALAEYQLNSLAMFELAPVGVVLAIAGGLYLLLIGSRFLPRHKPESLAEEYHIRQFLTEISVSATSPLAGKSIQESRIGEDFGATVLGILRGDDKILAPGKSTVLCPEDLLLVEISADSLARLREVPGIEMRPEIRITDRAMMSRDVGLAELTVAYNSHLVGRSMKEINFRQRYGLTALAVYRHGESLVERIGKIPLRFGDILLVIGTSERIQRLRRDPDFMLLQEVRVQRNSRKMALRAVAIMAGTVLVAAFGPWPVTLVFLAGCLAMVFSKCLSVDEAYSAINWQLLMLLAGMIALGKAMEESGAAAYLARMIVDSIGSYGPLALLSGFFFLTVLLTQPMSNSAAALLVLPIAINAARTIGSNPRTFAIMVTLAASCSFLSPFEPACVLVYGPGKYRFMDYLRVGALLTVVVYVVTILMVPMIWKL